MIDKPQNLEDTLRVTALVALAAMIAHHANERYERSVVTHAKKAAHAAVVKCLEEVPLEDMPQDAKTAQLQRCEKLREETEKALIQKIKQAKESIL